MNTPDFSRAQYADALPAEGASDDGLTVRQIMAGEAFPMAVLFGFVAMILCTFAYAFVWSFGFMLSIVAVGFSWVITKAMLTASKGYGGKLYQIVAVIFIYFTVTLGKLLLPVWVGIHHGTPLPVSKVLAYAFFGPILRLQTGVSGILGIVVLGYAIRQAWRLGKGTRS
jgi:hypothetical protein